MVKFKYIIDLESLRDKPLFDTLTLEKAYRKELMDGERIRYEGDCKLCIQVPEIGELGITLIDNEAHKTSRPRWEVMLWDGIAHINIGHWMTQNDRLTEAEYEDIKLHISKYAEGTIRCTRCNEWISAPKKDWKYRFYAGVYCQKCWDSDIATQAAADNFD